MENKSKQFFEKAWIKKITLLIESKRIHEALKEISEFEKKNNNHLEVSVLKGICDYELENYNEAITFCELGLASNLGPFYTSKALKILMQISIK